MLTRLNLFHIIILQENENISKSLEKIHKKHKANNHYGISIIAG